MKRGIGRRQFMRSSLAGAAAVPLIEHVLRADTQAGQGVAANDRIQVGIIGVGARAQAGVMQAAVAVTGVEVFGVCDAYQGRVTRALERLGNQAKDYGDWRALLADKSIDAVIIATPDHWHAPAALLAMEAGKHVYLEKPCSHNVRGVEVLPRANSRVRMLRNSILMRSSAAMRRWSKR